MRILMRVVEFSSSCQVAAPGRAHHLRQQPLQVDCGTNRYPAGDVLDLCYAPFRPSRPANDRPSTREDGVIARAPDLVSALPCLVDSHADMCVRKQSRLRV